MVSKGWTKGTIEDIAKVTSGGTPSRAKDSYWNGHIPWVTTSEVKFGVIADAEQKITQEGLDNSSAKLFPKDTILMAMYGQGKTRGQVAKLGIEASTNQACAALLLHKEHDVEYYYQFLTSQYENIRDLANSGGQQNLSAGIIKGIHVPIPPLPEQLKIAKILSTWDKAITTTEKLIATSKQQKKALMQPLLTGKKRLINPDTGKAFEGEWEYVRAGDIFSTRSNKKHNSDLPILAITQDQGAIPRELIDYNVSVTIDSISGYKVVEVGDFIISLRSFQGGIEYSKYKGICSPAYVILYPTTEISDAFYKYHLKSHPFIQAMKSRLEGIRDGKIISYKYFSEIKLPKPSLEEQQKIASVLTSADKEIGLLETKLAHLKYEKKALMQQLLTGRRRVKLQSKECIV
ncbi:restriction endonuclease subunit S [Shewanella sp. SG41-4]|uniref:restriction endonuclease subunit S n=1 Tax=Shewanella sp. SG41-4 TaxID=2760976 RepID=UPI0015FF7F19|nr:restriction endonuclease subunit S [Shewanella sp. SG41-4]MBB1440280.1 restriction endonuclease subunit S [Shewanella sp. SG41-4]